MQKTVKKLLPGNVQPPDLWCPTQPKILQTDQNKKSYRNVEGCLRKSKEAVIRFLLEFPGLLIQAASSQLLSLHKARNSDLHLTLLKVSITTPAEGLKIISRSV